MKMNPLIVSVWLLTFLIAGLARSQNPLSESAHLEPFPPENRTDEWSFTLEPKQSATYTVSIASSGTSPDDKTYNFRSSSYAVSPPDNINTIWTWSVSGSGQNYVCHVANTHWLEAETTVEISCTWASSGDGTGEGSGGVDIIEGWAKGIASAQEAGFVAGSDLEIEGAPDYLCIHDAVTLHAWLVIGEFPYDDSQPVDADWTVEPVSTNGGAGTFNITNGSSVVFTPTETGEVKVTASVPEGSGTLEDSVTFIIYEVQSITATPKGWPDGEPLPENISIGAGGIASDAHQADIEIQVLPKLAGIPVEVWLTGGRGHENSAELQIGGQTAIGDMDSVEVSTEQDGVIEGTLTSSDALDTCTIHACEKQNEVEFNWVTQFDPETDWLMEPGYLPVSGGVLTNTVRFRHHRSSMATNWVPFDQHEIRFFVERVVWIDTNDVVHVITNTPVNPSDAVDDWAVFDAPNTTDGNGEVTAKLTVYDNPELVEVTIVAYDWNVWREPPVQQQPLGMITLMGDPLEDERLKRTYEGNDAKYPSIKIEKYEGPAMEHFGWDDKSQEHWRYKEEYGEKPWVSVGTDENYFSWKGSNIRAKETYVRITVDPRDEYDAITVVEAENSTFSGGNQLLSGRHIYKITGNQLGHGTIEFRVGGEEGQATVLKELGVAVYDVVRPNTRYFRVSDGRDPGGTYPENVPDNINEEIGDLWSQALAWPEQKTTNIVDLTIDYDLSGSGGLDKDGYYWHKSLELTALRDGILDHLNKENRNECDALWVLFVKEFYYLQQPLRIPQGFYLVGERMAVIRMPNHWESCFVTGAAAHEWGHGVMDQEDTEHHVTMNGTVMHGPRHSYGPLIPIHNWELVER